MKSRTRPAKNAKLTKSAMPALNAMSVAVLTTLLASGAQAAPPPPPPLYNTQTGNDQTYALTDTVETSGGQITTNKARNISNVSATIDSNSGVPVSSSGPATRSTFVINSNTLQATAVGNAAAATVDAALRTSSSDGSLVINSVSVNDGGLVSSQVNNNSISVGLSGATTTATGVSIVNNANTIGASTGVNTTSAVISGQVRSSGTSTAGVSNVNYLVTNSQDPLSTVTGGTVVTTIQQANGVIGGTRPVGHIANAGSNQIDVNLTSNSTTPAAVIATIDVNNNAIATTYQGNDATNTVNLQGGASPSYANSVAVTNLQSHGQLDYANTPAIYGTATNKSSTIGGNVSGTTYYDGESTTTTAGALQGALNVKDNTVTSAATGNQSRNTILLGNSLSFAGAGTGSTGSTASYTTPVSTNNDLASINSSGTNPLVANVQADLLLVNSQNNSNAVVGSLNSAAAIKGSVDVMNGSASLSVAGNQATSAANGNVASNSLGNVTSTAGGVAQANGVNSVSGTAAVLNQQVLTNATTTEAVTKDAFIGARAGVDAPKGMVSNSTVVVDANTSSAMAKGNLATSSLALGASSLMATGANAVLTLNANTPGTASSSASGQATVANLQINDGNSPVSAMNAASEISLGATTQGQEGNTLLSNALSVTNNTQQAVAVGSQATNALTLAGTTVGSGAGLLNGQVNVGTGGSTLAVTAGLSVANVNIFALTNVEKSTLSLTNNLQSAVAYSNLATNTVNVTGNSIVLPATQTAPAATQDPTTGVPTVTAAYGLLNVQSGPAFVVASTTLPLAAGSDFADGTSRNGTGAAPIGIQLNGNLTTSTVHNDTNALAAAAYGNNATNAMALAALSNATPSGFVSVANVTNAQSLIGGSVSASATGSRSGSTNDAFVGGQIVGTQIDGNVISSTVSSSGNSIEALALGNRAVNQLAVTGGSSDTSFTGDARGSASANHTNPNLAIPTVDAAFSVLSSQVAKSSVLATQNNSNAPSGSALLTSPIGVTIGTTSSTGKIIRNSTIAADLNQSIASATANSATNVLSLTLDTLSASTTAVQNLQQTLQSTTVTALIGTSLGNQGGVTLALLGGSVSIANSTLSVSGNTTRGSVIDNAANSALSVTGNSITNASNRTVSQSSSVDNTDKALADHVLLNGQYSNNSLSSSVYGSFRIDTANAASITGSTLRVAGNAQTSSAVANTATNVLSLGGAATTSITGGSALASEQFSQGQVAVISALDLFTPAGVTGSTVAITGNSNTALAVGNDATNRSVVSATNIDKIVTNGTTATAGSVSTPDGAVYASADHVLANYQNLTSSTGGVSSAATTNLYNKEGNNVPNALLVNSSVIMTGITTVAEASANRALNSLSVTASNAQGASAALSNEQFSAANVNASASTVASLALTDSGIGATVLNNSTVVVDGNRTTALARGNTATNALVMTAGSGFTTALNSASTGATAVGAAALQNVQGNNGSVTATSTSANYQVALNTANPVLNGTLSVSNNLIAAQAVGNNANNNITLSALNGTTPSAALQNYQSNVGAVSATVSGAYYGSGITGGATGTAMRVGGNQIVATATGNSVVSSILAAR